ncbi:LysR substrate-binding domain-containing protein [Quatrionicoccus australiensis]|uniref:LysR substrate-binding domain-containing protein n=1 Tax=Quatrionicoccus australiensis TaxID=138118 RepID=UPI001CFB5B92|nr:LysR substrate-binding domain-containing protein [Quatrionicoccus australiensis]MCB4361348.1 LysR family transcriptional regulator [Quatrionicoccus australiensis]
MPSLKQIRYFLSVADLGGFTPAAAGLFVAQPALSRQIALLEEELGFALFVREPRGVRLTPAGALYRERVRGVEQLLAGAAEEGGQLAKGEAGVLRLLHSSSLPARSLLPAMQRFLEESPRARIDLDRIASETQIGEVAAGRADLGIIRLPVLRRDPAIRLLDLPPERLWVALPPAHALAGRTTLHLAELQDAAFVSAVHRERGGLARRVTELCLQRGFVPRTARIISRKTSMLDLVAAGLGIAVIPAGMTSFAPTGITFRPLADADAEAHSALLLPLQASPLAERFVGVVREMRGEAGDA